MMKRYCLTLCAALFLCVTLPAQQRKKIYLAPDDHTDLMWTADEGSYRDAILTMLDYYLDLNDSTDGEPYNIQSKWNCDGSYWMYLYSQHRTEQQMQRLVRQIRQGRITVPMNTLISLMGVAPIEAILRDMYYAGSMQRRYGLEFPLVLSMEDQVLPLGLSSLWAGAGAKYSWRGVCACATQVTGFDRRPHEVYWYTGLDGQRVLMKWYSVNPAFFLKPRQYQYNLGKYGEGGDHIGNAILECEELLQSGSHYPYHIAAAFGKGGDALQTLTDEYPRVAREASSDDYEVIVSNEVDFFRDMEQHYGDRLPSETLSYGSTEWGLAVTSMAELSASVKRAVEKLRTAELMYTLVAMRDSTFARQLDDMRRQAWFACGLYYEHDWTADGPHITRKQRADWQRQQSKLLTSYVDTLYQQAYQRLSNYIAGGDDTFFVLNPLGWQRTDYCDLDYDGPEEVHVVDVQTGNEVPCQWVMVADRRLLRILAPDIPSMGYKTFRVISGRGTTTCDVPFTCAGQVFENDFYRLIVNRQGTITSLIDKRHGFRECAKNIGGRLMNDLGGTIHRQTARGAELRFENVGPVSATLVAESYFPVKHSTRITLLRNVERVIIENVIDQNIGNDLITYTFSFNIDNPWVRTEEAGAILDVRQSSQGGHYADSICRLDWTAMNHFADISGRGGGMVLSNRDAYFMRTGNRTIDSLDVDTPQLTVLAGGKILPGLGIDYQDGDSHLENHFALIPYTGCFDAARSMRSSLEHQNPLVAGHSFGDQSVYGSTFSLLSLSNSNIVPWAVKPAEDGIDHGIIVRLWNLSAKDQNCLLLHALPIHAATEATHVETDIQILNLKDGKLPLRIGRHQLKTIRIK